MTTVLRKWALGLAAIGLLAVAGCGEDNEKNAMEGSKPASGEAPTGAPVVTATSSEEYFKQAKSAAEKAGISGGQVQGRNNPGKSAETPAAK